MSADYIGSKDNEEADLLAQKETSKVLFGPKIQSTEHVLKILNATIKMFED